MVNFLCIIQARMTSSRLPAKVMLSLGGKTLLNRVYDTVSESNKIDQIVIATSNHKSDDIISEHSQEIGANFFRGDLHNVLRRFFNVSKKYGAKNIVRITADNPLMDGRLIDSLIDEFQSSDELIEYIMYKDAVYGLSAEVFSFEALRNANENCNHDFDKEHVTPYIEKNSISRRIKVHAPYNRPEIRATIDTIDDYIRMESFYLFCQRHNFRANINNFIRYVDEDSIENFKKLNLA